MIRGDGTLGDTGEIPAIDPLWAGTEPASRRPSASGGGRASGAPPAPGTGLHDTPIGGVPIVRRRRTRRRKVLLTLLALFAIGVGYYGVSLYQVHSTGRSDQAHRVDAIVVMGAAQYDGRPSPQLEARLDHVVELWRAEMAPFVVVTGGNRPGDRFTEAGASKQYLEEQGIPEAAILMEDQGTNTYDSMVGVREVLRVRDLSTVLIVTDPFHSLRSRLIGQELGLTASVSPTRTSPVQGNRAGAREMKEALGVAVGRIIGFGRLTSITG